MAGHVEWISEELALYDGRGRDPSEVRARVGRRLFGYDAYRPHSFANSFSIELPVYMPSYFFATLLAPTLTNAVLADVGGELWPNRRVGPWLVDHWFREGTAYEWTERLRELTGGPLTAVPFNREMRPD
jgi:hypothetical protein